MNSHWDSKKLIKESIELFKNAGIPQPKLNAEIIMAYCMNKDRIDLYADYKKKMTDIETNLFRNLVKRRLKREPVQYIVGKTEFMSLPFYVNKYVLIPRPETEILLENVLNYVLENKKRKIKVLDYGTGSGNIIISLAKYAPGCFYYASDLSRRALTVAQKNCELNKIKQPVYFINGDMFNVFKKGEIFDCIVSNPPYIAENEKDSIQEEVIKYEPVNALISGEDGLNMIKYLLDNAYKFLKKDGLLAFEFGYKQSSKIKSYALRTGNYKNLTIIKDLSNKNRVILMNKK